MKFPKIHIKKRKPKAEPSVSSQNAAPQSSEGYEQYMPHEYDDDHSASPAIETAQSTVADEAATDQLAPSNSEAASAPHPQPIAADAKPQEAKTILTEKISINTIFSCIWRNKWKYIIPLIGTAALVSWLALSIPRYYKVTVMLAPEYNISPTTGSFSGLASSLGINVGSSSSSDAIVPMFYPDLIGSTDFLVPLFDVPITTKDGTYKGTYAEYITTQQKAPWWTIEINKLKDRIAPPPVSESRGAAEPINPFALTFAEDAVMRAIKASITCTVDKKTDVITLTTTAQDPLVAALIADTVRERLQDFIIQYRTSKARHDLAHAQMLCEKSHKDYLAKQKAYATFVDANQDLVLETFKAKEKDLEDEMQLAFNNYSQLLMRVQSAEAKVEERTPVFTVLQNASVPVKHEGPKRVFMVLGSLVAAFILTTIVIISRDKRVSW
ncbi:MAG: chain-length determining protein [Bacteroidaceae bacterium]|nr:chain-length determining protein [Bacteroidaceae bacterium]